MQNACRNFWKSSRKSPHLKPGQLPETPRGEIVFQDVSFAYRNAEKMPVVRDLSLTISPGETVAVVGPSGAGKSTLFSLLMRFYDPVSGDIRLNGVALPDLDPEDLRRHIALVPQDTAIFGASIAENIAYGRPEAARRKSSPPRKQRLRPPSSRRCRTATTPSSANAA